MIDLEIGMQQCEGRFEVRNPRLSFTPPPPDTTFPYRVPASPRCSLDIDTSRHAPFNNMLLGLNSQFMGSQETGYEDPRVQDLVRRLRIPLLRFPAGTVANWYDWETDQFYYPPDYDGQHLASMKARLAEGRKFEFKDYAALCREAGIVSTLTFNMFYDSIEKSERRLRDRLAAGLDIRWIEMGNENYDPGQRFGNIATIDKYISFTRDLIAALRKIDPKIQYAINVRADMGEEWAGRLAPLDYYDAVVVHPYVRAPGAVTTCFSIRPALDAYASVNKDLAAYRDCFGDRPLLFTEWGVLTDKKSTLDDFFCCLGVADEFFAILDGAENGPVEQACEHIFVGGGWPRGGSLYGWDRNTGNLVKGRKGVLYEMWLSTFRDAELFDARSKSPEIAPGLPAVNARAMRRPTGETVVYAVNKLPVAAPLDLSIDGKAYTGKVRLATFTETPLVGHAPYALDEDPLHVEEVDAPVTLPPYSIVCATQLAK